MKRKLLALMLTFCMLVCCMPAAIYAEDDFGYLELDDDNDSEEKAESIRVDIGEDAAITSPYVYYYPRTYSLEYKWYRKDGGKNTVLSGKTDKELVLNNITKEDFGMYFVTISLSNNGRVLRSVNAYYQLVDNYGLNIKEISSMIYVENGTIPQVTAEATCKPEYEQYLCYQWYYIFYDDDDDDVYRRQEAIEGETSKNFTATEELMNKADYFYCVVTITGYDEIGVETNRFGYRKVDQIVNLSTDTYNDKVSGKKYSYYTQKIVAEEGTKGILLTFKPNSDDDYSIIAEDGTSFYIDSYRTKSILIPGRSFYISSYLYSSSFGLSKVEPKDVFEKQVYLLRNRFYPNKGEYQYGERINLEGLEVIRYYNDGSEETVPLNDLEYEDDTGKLFPDYYLTITDKVSGLCVEIYIDIENPFKVSWEKRPDSIMLNTEEQRASISVEVPYNFGRIKYLWMLVDEQDQPVAEIEDDTEPEIVLPKNVKKGQYYLCCYYYNDKMGFSKSSRISTPIRIEDEKVFKADDDCPESVHKFSVTTTKGYQYKSVGAKSLSITFDAKTKLDAGDSITIYDNNNKKMEYKNSELAGKTIQIDGDTMRLLLYVTDYSSAWGFKVNNIEAIMEPEPTVSPTPESPQPTVVVPSPAPTADVYVKAPAKAVISKFSVKKTTATVTLKKITAVNGYEIVYAKNKVFTKGKKMITTTKTTNTIKKLSKKTTYYFKARAFKKDANGKKVYGKWSNTKNVTIKK